MAESPEQIEIEKWRSKYYDQLQQLEQQEREWQRLDEVLRQYASRLSLAVDNNDAELQKLLKQQREIIRKGGSATQFEGMLTEISTVIARLEEDRRKGKEPGEDIWELLLSLHDSIPYPRGMGRKAKSLRKQIMAGRSELKEALDGLAGLIRESLDWVAAEGEERPERKGLLGKLLGDKRGPDSISVEPESPGEGGVGVDDALALARGMLARLLERLKLEQAAALEQLANTVEGARNEQVLERVVRDLSDVINRGILAPAISPEESKLFDTLPAHEVILRLLERLTLPPEQAPKIEKVKALVSETMGSAELDKVIIAIADLVGDMVALVSNEKQDLEQFLRQLNDNLEDIETHLMTNLASQQQGLANGVKLDEAVNAQIHGIEQSVAESDNVNQLKDVITGHLGHIREQMATFRGSEKARVEAAEAEVEQLKARLQGVESETELLRKRILAERRNAIIDPLTEIPNRLAYNERIEQEYQRWKRFDQPLTLSVWDVDLFKSVNDTYGHQAGDKVLKVVATLLSSLVRETDFAARYGGEEFVILLPETDLNAARVVADKLRSRIEQTEFHHRDRPVKITISCGIAQFKEGDTAETVFARADKALYRAKQQGRNQCLTEND